MTMMEQRLEALKREVMELHNLAKKSVKICLDGLKCDDKKRIEACKIEQEADVLHTDIDFNCVTAIALFQPVARDLRFIVSMMKISSSYERITDLTQEISMYECMTPPIIDKFEDMQSTILKMFEVVEDAYAGNVENLKSRLWKLDDKVDKGYVEVIDMITDMGMCSADIVLAARHMERIGDLLGKVGSRIIFIEEGRRVWIK